MTTPHSTHRLAAYLATALFAMTACAHTLPSPETRAANVASMTAAAGWTAARFDDSYFQLTAFRSRERVADDGVLTIYIEGDGLAWRSSSLPSDDPTPVDPLALRLALKDQGAVAWLARPCQYTRASDAHCETKYWTSHRFADNVIASTNDAIDALKSSSNATAIRLIGYSGGAAVATLVAARRSDVRQLVTIAGNLDHRVWTTWHALTPLSGSLNPSDVWSSLQDVPQIHFVGGRDEVVGRRLADAFASHFPADHQPFIRVIANADHHHGWEEQWPQLLEASH